MYLSRRALLLGVFAVALAILGGAVPAHLLSDGAASGPAYATGADDAFRAGEAPTVAESADDVRIDRDGTPLLAQARDEPDDSPVEYSEERYEGMKEVARTYLGWIAFLGGVVLLLDLLAVRLSRALGSRWSWWKVGRQFTRRKAAVRAAWVLLWCWWGAALVAGGTTLWATAGATAVGGLLAGGRALRNRRPGSSRG